MMFLPYSADCETKTMQKVKVEAAACTPANNESSGVVYMLLYSLQIKHENHIICRLRFLVMDIAGRVRNTNISFRKKSCEHHEQDQHKQEAKICLRQRSASKLPDMQPRQ